MVKTHLSSISLGKYSFSAPSSFSDPSYVGPKAIFDPNFIPESRIDRPKQATQLSSLVLDALLDEYATNVNIYGLKGSGKNLLINHFMSWLDAKQQNIENDSDHAKQNVDPGSFLGISVDCAGKEIEQVFFALVDKIGAHLDHSFQAQQIFSLTTPKLWNLLKFLLKKIEVPVLMHIQNSESMDPIYLDKLFQLAKDLRSVQILTSMNTGGQSYRFKKFEQMDHKIRMDLYSGNEIREITNSRAKMAMKSPLNPESIDLMVDYVMDFDLHIPGASINLLKQVYPVVQDNGELTSEDLRSICQYQFEGLNFDAISMADFVMQTSIEERLFLEYLMGYFENSNRYYIPYGEIKNAYRMTAEELGFKINQSEFRQSFAKITEANILRPGQCYIHEGMKAKDGVLPVAHFLTMPIEEVSEIMNLSFGMFMDDDDEDANLEF